MRTTSSCAVIDLGWESSNAKSDGWLSQSPHITQVNCWSIEHAKRKTQEVVVRCLVRSSLEINKFALAMGFLQFAICLA